MLRIAVVADSHFDLHSRFEECIRLHNWIAQDAARRGVQATIHTGDVYERKSNPLEREAAAAWFQLMAALGPVAIIRGNHDAVDDLPLLERLDARHPITVVEGARVVELAGAVVACMGWPQRGRLAALLPDRSREEVEAAGKDALVAVLRGLGDQLRAHEGKPRLFAAHVMVRGSVTSTGQPLVGCDFELGLEDLALVGADAYLLGHIHKGQAWDIEGAPVVYPGSPRRTAFGELEPKGYVVLECDQHGVRTEFVEAPATRMVQLEGTWRGRLELDEVHNPDGAEVRLRYHVASDEREAARAEVEEYAAELLVVGALSVKVEEVVIAETRSRAPEVARAVSLADKVQALWTLKQFDPGERRAGLLAKLGAVEEEVRLAS